MDIYAIGDLHLPGNTDKTMDMFGRQWEGHQGKIEASWDRTVQDTDIVLMPGDFSWALKLEHTGDDFKWLEQRSGKKILIKGNHDFWWDSVSKVRAFIPDNTFVLQNDSLVIEGVAFAGTRYWDDTNVCWPVTEQAPDMLLAGITKEKKYMPEENERILFRELHRLEMSLQSIPDDIKKRVAMLHFPPVGFDLTTSRAVPLLEQYGIKTCVFGHIHSGDRRKALEKEMKIDDIAFYPVSADYLGFKLRKVDV